MTLGIREGDTFMGALDFDGHDNITIQSFGRQALNLN